MARADEALRQAFKRARNRIAYTAGRRPRWTVASKLPKNGVGAEIGVFRGDFSAQLLKLARPERIHLIDPWQNKLSDGDALHDGVCRRFAGEIQRGTVVVHRAPSAEVATTLEPLDWVYVDGNHSYENVSADLTGYFSLLKPGGIIAGDDYGVDGCSWGDGVRQAVDEFVRLHGLQAAIVGQQFIIEKPSDG
jgi:predicted O-methyltransferase YrrM